MPSCNACGSLPEYVCPTINPTLHWGKKAQLPLYPSANCETVYGMGLTTMPNSQQLVTSSTMASTMLPPPAPSPARAPKLASVKSEPSSPGSVSGDGSSPSAGPILVEATSSIPDLGEYTHNYFGGNS
ncbi:hypothetical protein B566_EDAN003841 [Ephemera danica]|nr:hypothetical protein B566_EDAN003841 [Ephemera danica]